MRIPAERFLKLRAIGAPAVVVYLAIQGIFRGFKDTKTPVLCLGRCLAGIIKYQQVLRLFLVSLTGIEHKCNNISKHHISTLVR
jgi:hypothetical protein